MSVTVFSWSDFGPESKGLDTKKTAELIDSLRFLCFAKRPPDDKADLGYRVSVVASGAGGIRTLVQTRS